MRFYIVFYLLTVTNTDYAWCQADSTILLRPIMIEDDRLATDMEDEYIDQLTPELITPVSNTNLSTLLTQYSGLNIRSYGLGGLSTVAMRGTGSGHTAVLWEGFHLQSIMNGTTDLSQIPIAFVDKVSLQYGSGVVDGASAMGGTIYLQSTPLEFEKALKLNHTYTRGSFEATSQNFSMTSSGNFIATRIRVLHQSADNEYPYLKDGKQFTLAHAATKKWGILLESNLKLSDQQKLSVKYWLQNNDIQIPSSSNRATQNDEIRRGFVKYERVGNKTFLGVKSGILWQRLHYQSPTISSISPSYSWVNESITDTQVCPWWRLKTVVNYTYENANTLNYGANAVERQRIAIAISNNIYLHPIVTLHLMTKQLVYDGIIAPFASSASIHITLLKGLSIQSKIAKNFKLPTFNALYWANLGNPNLVSEQGLSVDCGIEYSYQTKNGNALQSSITPYYHHIKDWIQWQPDDGGQWRPKNVNEIWSFGIEYRGVFVWTPAPQTKIKILPNYTVTYAYSERRKGNMIFSTSNNQLIYTPIHQGGGTLLIASHQFGLSYTHNYIGLQYTTEDNKARWALPAYQIAQASFSYLLKLNNTENLKLWVEVRNLWDKQYFTGQEYPMPKRHYQFTIQYQLNN